MTGFTDPPGFSSRLETYSVRIGHRWTTIRLEPEMMEALREIGTHLDVSIHELCTDVAVDCYDGSFTSALRVFILNHFRALAPRIVLARDGAMAPTRVAPAVGTREPRRDWMRRRPVADGARDAAAPLVAFYQWWLGRRDAADHPPTEIDPRVIKDLGLQGLVHVVEVGAADPLRYRFRLWARRVRQSGSSDFSGRLVGDLPGPDYRSAAAEDYLSVATSGAPRFQRIDASLNGARRAYQRLILPFSRSDGKPDRLLVAVSYQAAGLVG